MSDNDSFVLHAESDEDAGTADDLGAQKQLALVETGRFTGVFQGYLRLTDADGNGEGRKLGFGSRRVRNTNMPTQQKTCLTKQVTLPTRRLQFSVLAMVR